MASYEKCIPVILKNEGGFTDDKFDKGGATNFGISVRFAEGTGDLELFDMDQDGDIDRDDMYNLTQEVAEEAYKKYFWDKYRLDDLTSDKKALVIFDAAVNHGIPNTTAMVQKAIDACGETITVDGKFGPKTFSLIESLDEDVFIESFLNIRSKFYNRIVEKNPTQSKFLKGWLNRIKNLQKDLSNL